MGSVATVAQAGSDLTMTITKEGADTVVTLAGDLDIHTAAQLRECLFDLIHDSRTRLVIDLAALDFADSTGLGTLVSAMQRVRQVGGQMVLRSPTAATRRVIEITGLGRVLPIRD